VEAINRKRLASSFLLLSIFVACRGIKEAMFKAETPTPFLLMKFKVSCRFVMINNSEEKLSG
jgi:hypothetical protein